MQDLFRSEVEGDCFVEIAQIFELCHAQENWLEGLQFGFIVVEIKSESHNNLIILGTIRLSVTKAKKEGI